MKRQMWPLLFAASLLVNVGVIASAWLPAWRSNGGVERALFGMGHEQVPDHLRLDAAQRERWHALEADFVRALEESGREIERHRERLVHAILAEAPQPEAIERERAAIFALQEAQQRAVIAQLQREREVLRPEQRAALAELLLAHRAGGGSERH
jgi:Spy/CpxP family protein refolding chaperone